MPDGIPPTSAATSRRIPHLPSSPPHPLAMASWWSASSSDWNAADAWTYHPAADDQPHGPSDEPSVASVEDTTLPQRDSRHARHTHDNIPEASESEATPGQDGPASHGWLSSVPWTQAPVSFGPAEFAELARHQGHRMTDSEAARKMEHFREEAIDTRVDFIDLTDGARFDWQRFILGQGASVLRGASIVRFVATFLPGISDASRLGNDRWDFVAISSNNTLTRFHPSRHQSAEVLYSAMLEEWNVCGQLAARPPGARGHPADYQGVMLTVAQATHANISRHDKLGVREAKQIIQRLVARHPDEDLLDVTDGRDFQWWRFFANCGRYSHQIIGDGIVKVHIRLSTESILVRRSDGSQATVIPTTPRVTVCLPASGSPIPPPNQW